MVTLAYYLVLEDALIIQRALTLGGTITVLLLYSLTILDLTKEENMLIFSGAVKCNLSKLETNSAVILPSAVSVHYVPPTFNVAFLFYNLFVKIKVNTGLSVKLD